MPTSRSLHFDSCYGDYRFCVDFDVDNVLCSLRKLEEINAIVCGGQVEKSSCDPGTL
jgi:hypothetical protein